MSGHIERLCWMSAFRTFDWAIPSRDVGTCDWTCWCLCSLIVLALKHFEGTLQSDQLISSYLLCKTRWSIRKHIREMSLTRAPPNNVIKVTSLWHHRTHCLTGKVKISFCRVFRRSWRSESSPRCRSPAAEFSRETGAPQWTETPPTCQTGSRSDRW